MSAIVRATFLGEFMEWNREYFIFLNIRNHTTLDYNGYKRLINLEVEDDEEIKNK